MKDKIQELLTHIGRPYQSFFDDKTYLGCFYPLYFLYPFLPKFKLPSKDKSEYFMYSFNKINSSDMFEAISENELQQGDIIVTSYKKQLHIGIYYEFGKMIHTLNNVPLEITRVQNYKSRFMRYYRVVL